jgi:hypothetical protein
VHPALLPDTFVATAHVVYVPEPPDTVTGAIAVETNAGEGDGANASGFSTITLNVPVWPAESVTLSVSVPGVAPAVWVTVVPATAQVAPPDALTVTVQELYVPFPPLTVTGVIADDFAATDGDGTKCRPPDTVKVAVWPCESVTLSVSVPLVFPTV